MLSFVLRRLLLVIPTVVLSASGRRRVMRAVCPSSAPATGASGSSPT